MSENPLFRKAALDKLASPERLDVLMRVTSPMGWMALTTVAGILIGVIVWSILGSIPERIDGKGVLLRGGANKEIRSTGSGTLASLDLKEGQMITVGQVLGTISAAGNNEEVNVARTKVQQLEQQRASSSMDAGQTEAAAQGQIARLRGDLDLKRLDLQRAQAEVARLEPLFKDGGITAQRMEGARSQVSAAQSQITSLNGQISAEETRARSARSGGAGLNTQIEIARAELQRVLARVGSQESLTSSVSGRVIEVRKNLGDTVAQNDVVATLEDATATVQVIAFVNANVGRRILAGMPAEVSPTDVKREEFGFMLANVSERGEFAATDAYIMSRMRNESVTKELTAQGTVIEVRAALKPKESTASGFEWSTSGGPPTKIGGNTLVSINIVVARKAPITMVMPFLRKTFGVAEQPARIHERDMSDDAVVEAEKPKVIPPPPRKRVKTPTILQMEAVECGAAALAKILAHFGRWVALEELRHECGVSRDGSKASNVLRAARKYGLDAKGYKYEEIEKLYTLPFPVILFWNFNHFVVLEGFGKGKAYLNDPAQGPREISMAELDGSYSGVVLTFAKGAEFQKGGQAPNMLPALRRRLVGSEGALFYVMICGLLLVIPGLVIPTFTRIFIDDYLVGSQEWIVRPLLWFMAATIAIQAVLTWLQRYYLLRLETKLALGTSSRFFNHILRLPAAYFGQRFAGEIGSRVQINDDVAKIIGGRLATTTIDSVLTIFYATLMFLYDAKLTFAVLLLSAFNIAAVKAASRARTDASRRLKQDLGKLQGTAMNGLKMIETLKATGSEGEFFGRWAGYYAKSLNTTQQLGVLGQIGGAVPPFVQTATTAAVLVLGGLKVMEGDFTVGMLVAYQTLLGSFTRPLASFVNFSASLQELQADMNRLDDVLRYPADAQYRDQAEPVAAKDGSVATAPAADGKPAGAPAIIRPPGARVKLSGKVELRGITFGYSPLEKPLISDFNLLVEPGRRVALVGGSGSGKSTVAKIISGLYEAWGGEILFDDVPRQNLPRDLIVNSLAVVDQEVFLFGGSVTENVTMWDPTITGPRVVTAARDAAIDEVIAAREGGYSSRIVEGGGNFSGGQCQRLEIARALVGEPTIVVMDEATSALDPTTEMLIDESMRRRGCTTIIIAHRLSTIRDSDEIIVMERGSIVQRGTHDEMKDIDGPYKHLVGHQ